LVNVNSISKNSDIRNQNYLYLFKQEIKTRLISISKYKRGKNLSLIINNNKYFESTVGLNVSQEVRTFLYFSFESFIFSQIIGHILGDGSLSMS
jgi:hypothetical protein